MNPLPRFTLILSLFLFVLFLFWQATAAQPAPDALTIGPTEFGMAFVNSAEDLRSTTRIQRGINSGAKLDRFPLYWNVIEPAAGQFNWSTQDAALRANEQQGLGTLAILLGTSGAYWPSGVRRPEKMPEVGDGRRMLLSEQREVMQACQVAGTPPPTGLHQPIFADGSDNPAPNKPINANNPWARFVEQAVKRYQPGGTAGLNVQYWEVWNEPDLCHFWGGTLPDYVRMLKVAYLVIKNVDPDATVMWGGLALFGPKYDGGANFLHEMVAAIRADGLAGSHNGFFDVAAVHQYSNVTNSFNNIRRIQNALAGTGWQNKPIWVTESGVPVCDSYPGPSCPSPYRGNQEEQAAYIWQNIAYTRLANNNGPIFHFQLHDDGGNQCLPSPPADGFGLFTNEPGVPCVPHHAEPRLAYYAYLQATQYFANTELLWGHIQETKIRRVAFYHAPSKERRTLVWAIDNRGGTTRLTATSNSARRIALDGSETAITPASGSYYIDLPPATNQNQPGDSAYTIGGKPYLIIEKDTHPPTASINELWPLSPPSFNVNWQVNDFGSGLAANSVTVLYEVNQNGQWHAWLNNQAASGSALFTGQPNTTYRFAIQATDRAGNRNPTPVALAKTVINDGTQIAQVTGQILTMRGQPASWVNVNIGPVGKITDIRGRFAFDVPWGQWDIKVQGQTWRHGIFFTGNRALTLVYPPTTNAVTNGSFEASDPLAGWQPSGSSPVGIEQVGSTEENVLQLATRFVADPFVPGNKGAGSGGNSTISQRLIVPTGNPHLAFAYQVESTENDSGTGSCANVTIYHDKFEVIIVPDGQAPSYIHCQETASDWQYRFLDLSAFAGQPVTLIFNLYQSSSVNPTTARVELVTIGESPALAPPLRWYFPIFGR